MTWGELESLLDSMVEETLWLELKGAFWEDKIKKGIPADTRQTFWSAQSEAAKDVAAMLNAQGGLLVLGVKEQPRNVPLAERLGELPNDADSTLVAWLRLSLQPAEAASRVSCVWLSKPRGGAASFSSSVGSNSGAELVEDRNRDVAASHRVLVVSVEPWTSGPVGVALQSREIESFGQLEDRTVYLFPRRVGRTVKFLRWESVDMHSLSDRKHFLRLTDLRQNRTNAPVRIASALEVSNRFVTSGGLSALPVHKSVHAAVTALLQRQAALVEISETGFTLSIGRLTYPEAIALGWDDKHAFEQLGDGFVDIPYELVEAVWGSTRNGSVVINIMLNAILHLGESGEWQLARATTA